MNKSRRFGAIVAMATAAVGMATVSMTAPAAAAQRGPEPVASWLRAVKAHSDTWIKIHWRTNLRVCNASVKYDSKNVDINYWGNRNSADFSRGGSLFPGHADHNTIEVNPRFAKAGVAKVRAVVSFDTCRFKAKSQSKTFWLALPVQSKPGQGNGGQKPTTPPTTAPTVAPTTQPTTAPTVAPTTPTTTAPTTAPTKRPSKRPSTPPATATPTAAATVAATTAPATVAPTTTPTTMPKVGAQGAKVPAVQAEN